jgi:hypothetical protein
MHFINHIIEPIKLLLAWQSSDETHRTRYIIGKLNRAGDKVNLTYLTDTSDFRKAQEKGFESYWSCPSKVDTNLLNLRVITKRCLKWNEKAESTQKSLNKSQLI